VNILRYVHVYQIINLLYIRMWIDFFSLDNQTSEEDVST